MKPETQTPETKAASSQVNNPRRLAEQLADALWRIAEGWNDFARTSLAVPLMRALDGIGLQLALTRGRTTVKQYLQYIANAQKGIVPVDFYLQRAARRGVLEPAQAEQFRAQLIALAQVLDQHAQSIVQATNKKIAEQKQQPVKQTKPAQKKEEAVTATENTTAH